MAYKFSKGARGLGDITFEDDSDTGIDFEQDTIKLETAGNEVLVVSGSKVGIGTSTPDYALDVAGDIGVNEYIYHNGDTDTTFRFRDDQVTIHAGNLSMIDMEQKVSAPHEVTINNGQNNIDFIVKGNGSNAGNPLLKCDASTGMVGINGVDSPAYELDVAGTIRASVDLYTDKIRRATDSSTTTKILLNDEAIKLYAGHSSNQICTIDANGITTTVPIHISGSVTEGLRIGKAGDEYREIQFETDGVDTAYIHVDSTEGLKIGCQESGQEVGFYTTGGDGHNERMRVTSGGWVGIGTTAPSCFLDINSNSIRLRTTKTPSSASDTGDQGQICWDSSYLYICVASNTWKRIALSSW